MADPDDFAIGQRVFAIGQTVSYWQRFNGGDFQWYKGATVIATHADNNTYDICEWERRQRPDRVKAKTNRGLQVGEEVDFYWRGGTVAWPYTIEKINEDGTYDMVFVQKGMPASSLRPEAEDGQMGGLLICGACFLSFIYLAMMALGTMTAGPAMNRDVSRHTSFYIVKETGCNRHRLPWFRSNYNMTLDANGWSVMPGWAVCPVSGVYNSCPNCLPDPNGGEAPTFSYTNCIYFNNDKFWSLLDRNGIGNGTSFGNDAAFLAGPVQQMTLSAMIFYSLYPAAFLVGFCATTMCDKSPNKSSNRALVVSLSCSLVFTIIATGLWIASYVQIAQTAFAQPALYLKTLFRSCRAVTVAQDSGARIHLACCNLSALTAATLAALLMVAVTRPWTLEGKAKMDNGQAAQEAAAGEAFVIAEATMSPREAEIEMTGRV